MKITKERFFFPKLCFACISAFLLFLGTSCQKDAIDDTPTKLVGTWQHTSRIVDGTQVIKDSTRLLMQLSANNICILCDSTSAAVKAKNIIKRCGWDYSGGLFNIAIDLPASWKVVAETNTLKIKRVDFKADGSLSKTVLKFDRIANIVIK